MMAPAPFALITAGGSGMSSKPPAQKTPKATDTTTVGLGARIPNHDADFRRARGGGTSRADTASSSSAGRSS
jgi:hypothetical protein